MQRKTHLNLVQHYSFLFNPGGSYDGLSKRTGTSLQINNFMIYIVDCLQDLLYLNFNFLVAAMKYVLVTGGVISGIGKGVISSSLGTLFKSHGLKVTPIKMNMASIL